MIQSFIVRSLSRGSNDQAAPVDHPSVDVWGGDRRPLSESKCRWRISRSGRLARWALAMALTNIPPILALPFLFRLDLPRSLIAIGASAAIVAGQLVLRSPPNLNAVIGYIAIAAIAHRAQDLYDLFWAIASIAGGLLLGVACGYDPCTPIAIFIAPLTGIIVRVATSRSTETLLR